jgi:hypothetical protein
MSNNVIKIFNSLEFLHPDDMTISRIKRALQRYPYCEDSLIDAYSIGQLKSKFWLIENLPSDLGLVFICAGWYGTLASFMFDRARGSFAKIRSFDVDPTCAPVADCINKQWEMMEWQFKASTLDITKMTYPLTYTTNTTDNQKEELTEMPNTIINTSCEHIEDFNEWYSNIPSGTILALQSNNFFEINQHTNCVDSLEDFEIQTPMSLVMFNGELDLGKYKRFMRIGIK